MGIGNPNQRTWSRCDSLKQRFIQPGNAVCVPVAAALGRCLLKAAVGQAPVGQPVISVPDTAYQQASFSFVKVMFCFLRQEVNYAQACCLD